MIRDIHGYVPGPLYVCAVVKRQKGSEAEYDPNRRRCFVCKRGINKGDYYIAHYRPDIFLCEGHIEGINGLSGDNAWPGRAGVDSKPESGEPSPTPSRTRDSPGNGPEHSRPGPVRLVEDRAAADRTRAQLEVQNWRCAYPCDGEEGGPLLPGESWARAFDNSGIVHLDCAKAGTIPVEGNPHTRKFDTEQRRS
jgi:hypothetical protein